jgi:hypothetical protein
LKEHSDQIPHNVQPIKAVARMTESGGAMFKNKYEENEV